MEKENAKINVEIKDNGAIKIGDKEYLLMGNKLLEIERYEEVRGKRVPIIKVETEEIKHEDGRQDVKIHVPFVSLKGGK